jgi:hypothetical protein
MVGLGTITVAERSAWPMCHMAYLDPSTPRSASSLSFCYKLFAPWGFPRRVSEVLSSVSVVARARGCHTVRVQENHYPEAVSLGRGLIPELARHQTGTLWLFQAGAPASYFAIEVIAEEVFAGELELQRLSAVQPLLYGGHDGSRLS